MSISSVRSTVLSKRFFDVKKALRNSAFLLLGCLFLLENTFAAPSSPCRSDKFDQTVEILDVIDGDTLLLTNKRFIRLIGINTPELNPKNPPAEPLANEARSELQKLLGKEKKVHVLFGKERHDRYQRQLAHVFLSDGQNIQATLLEQGTGAHIFFPPNDRFYDCYRAAETKARKNKRGIWSHPRFQTHTADELTLRHLGFYRVSGRIIDVKTKKGTVWLVTNKRFSFRIDAKNMKYFKNMKPELLRTHSIEVSGWIFPYKSGLNMRIHHPNTIAVLD